MVGTRTNDIPALKEANLGIAMGIESSELAKECSDIVISVEDFNPLVTILSYGRYAYNNISKYNKESCKEGLEKSIQVDLDANCDVQATDKNEKAPYGPWLLVLYGKQGNRYFKLRNGKAGNGNGFNVAKNGSDGKTYADGSCSVRKMEGDFTNVRSGKKSYATSKNAKTFEGFLNTEGGSRFDILSKEMYVSMNEGFAIGGTNIKGKTMLADITNHGSQGGKPDKWLKKSSKKPSLGDKMTSKMANHQGIVGYSKGNKVVKGNLQVQSLLIKKQLWRGTIVLVCYGISIMRLQSLKISVVK
ncbi:hypothetical protein Q3G72_031658 [Acer saccharum]|nr:hypothetical protein Q3G72_031658 [Acer saccharum]